MPRPLDVAPLPPTDPAARNFDAERLRNVVRALEYLAREARKTGIEEVVSLVESGFRIIALSYGILPLADLPLPAVAMSQSRARDAICDLQHTEHIVSALDFLHGQAAEAGAPEVATIIHSIFEVVMTVYYAVLRYSLADLPPSA